MNRHSFLTILVLLCGGLTAGAQLIVQAEAPKTVGQKAVVKLTLKNTFQEAIESARATLFLLDAQGKMVGQGTQWVIGGNTNRPALGPDATATFHFVVTADKPFSRTKLTFTRLVLEGGRLADPIKDVRIESLQFPRMSGCQSFPFPDVFGPYQVDGNKSAQGCAASATLGPERDKIQNPEGVSSGFRGNPFRVANLIRSQTVTAQVNREWTLIDANGKTTPSRMAEFAFIPVHSRSKHLSRYRQQELELSHELTKDDSSTKVA